MKFSCESHDLAYALNKCSRLARPSKTHPVARNVLIEAHKENRLLLLSATDVVSAYVTYTVRDVNVEKSGAALVDAGSFATFVSAVSGTVSAYVTPADRFMVKCDGKKISLRQDSRALPELSIPEDLVEPVITLDGNELSDLLGISFMADRGDMVASLSGTYLLAKNNILHAVASSGFRFAKASLPIQYSKTSRFLLPASTGRLLPYYLHDDAVVSIYANEKHMWFVTHRFSFACNGINERYPYTTILNHLGQERPNTISVNKLELENALKVCKELADVTNVTGKRAVFLVEGYGAESKKGTITISTSAENEIGDMEWTIITENNIGKSFSFALNIDYLDDILTVLNRLAKSGVLADFEGTNLVNISAGEKENESAIFFSSNTKNSVFAIMPMKV